MVTLALALVTFSDKSKHIFMSFHLQYFPYCFLKEREKGKRNKTKQSTNKRGRQSRCEVLEEKNEIKK